MIEGQGLHGARPATVRLSRCDGRTRLRRDGEEAGIDELVVVDTARSTTVARRDGRLRVATVEHLFAALAAFGAHEGVRVDLEGPELPLVDGGAVAFAEALTSLGIEAAAPRLRVAADGVVEIGSSRYTFRRGERTSVVVRVDFGDARLAPEARWDGDREDFRARIAPARTFGFEHEVAELLARGLASHVDRESVVVIGAGRILSAGRPFAADEPARHKLLDLIGDLFVHGGPPVGVVEAERPGHAATHQAVRTAIDRGLLTPALALGRG